jgi:carbon-monoxide dehydrogenase large subunit
VAARAGASPLIKGVGESGAISPGAAISNAVEDALADFGITIRELPLTPARIFTLLKAAGAYE